MSDSLKKATKAVMEQLVAELTNQAGENPELLQELLKDPTETIKAKGVEPSSALLAALQNSQQA